MRAVIVLKSDPTLNGCLNSELLFWKNFFDESVEVLIYSNLKSRLVSKLQNLFETTDCINIGKDIILTDQGDQNFFAGVVSPNQYKAYKIFSDHTNKGGLLLFRCPDSEMAFVDVVKALQYSESVNKDNLPAYFERSEYAEPLYRTKLIDYNYVRFLKNGNPKFNKWFLKQPNQCRAFDDSLETRNSLYPGDNLIFNVMNDKLSFGIKFNYNPINKFVHFGFFKSVGVKKEKVFSTMNFKDVDLYAVGLKNPEKIQFNIIELDKPLIGKEYISKLNEYLGYIFIGKGDLKNDVAYINKTIYDCYLAKLPILILESVDKTHKIFPEVDCYFESDEDLENIKNKYEDFYVRLDIVKKQAKIIEKHLKYESRNY